MEHLEVVDCHLQDLRLLQLGRALLLEGRRHETPQLREGIVDAVTTPLLDDAATPLAGHAAAGGAVIAAAENGGKRRLISVSEMLKMGGRGGGIGSRNQTGLKCAECVSYCQPYRLAWHISIALSGTELLLGIYFLLDST